jgi:hypothetical protein
LAENIIGLDRAHHEPWLRFSYQMPLQNGQHAGENLEAEIFFVAQPIGSSLEYADFVVEAFDEAERDLVFRLQYAAMPSQWRSIMSTKRS